MFFFFSLHLRSIECLAKYVLVILLLRPSSHIICKVSMSPVTYKNPREINTFKNLKLIFSAGLFVVLLPLPESPVWLETQGLDNEASMKWLHLSKHGVAKVKEDTQE